MTWPSLPLAAWKDTRDTLHRYAQIVGKLQLVSTPAVNHFWNVALQVTARGLATTALAYQGRTLDIEMDLVEHRLLVRVSDGGQKSLALEPRPVADFYRALMATLASLGVEIAIWDHPVEIPTDAIPFPEDRKHATYDREQVTRFFQVLSNARVLMEEFRARFLGKASPVGFYWGTFDLAAARYSGRRAPIPPNANIIEREGYSHEVSEVGFWTGDARLPEAGFFALHAPAPEGFAGAAVRPAAASWQKDVNCFALPYETVRRESDPEKTILDFFQSTYEAGATLAGWDRTELERAEGGPNAR